MKYKEIESLIPKDSWLLKWMQCWPLSESPRSFILLAGMSALGAAVGRRVYLDMDYRKIYPMLNLLVTGPSGLGKTEAITLAQNYLLKRVPTHRQPMMVEGESTRAKLMDDLAAKPHAVLLAEEMASFFTKQRYQEDMIPFVTELLNYKEQVERRTKSGDIVIIVKPEVTFVCGSTPDWLQKMLPDSAIGGGFLPRFLVVFEEHKAQFIPLPQTRMTPQMQAKLDKLREEVGDEFVALTEVEGPIKFQDYSAMEAFEKWAFKHKPASGHLAPFAERAREFVLRLSIIFALSRGHLYIDETDIHAASGVYEWAIEKLQRVVVPMTPEGEMLSKVLELFRSPNDAFTERQIKRAMRNYMRSDSVIKNVESLLQSGDLERLPDGKLRRIFK